METKPHLGDQEFAGALKNNSPAPNTFKYKLSLNGAPIGWIGRGGSFGGMWAEVVPNESDAVTLEWYTYYGVDYLRIPGYGYMTWSGGRAGHPVAFNTWSYANGWKEEGGHLVAVDSGAP